MNLGLFVFLTALPTDLAWNDLAAEFTIKKPDFSICQEICFSYDEDLNEAVAVKSGNVCKCVYVYKPLSKELCAQMCKETERLEGSGRDICSHVDNVCYTYKFLRRL